MNSGRKLFLVSLLFALVIPLSAQQGPANSRSEYDKIYKWRITQKHLNEVYIPRDLTDAFIQLNKLIEPADKAKFKNAPEDLVAEKLHPTLGRWMVHNWGFAGGSRLSHYIKSAGIGHPDDMANFLMVMYHRHLNDKDLNIRDQVAIYKERRAKIFLKSKPSTKAILEQNAKVLEKKEKEAKAAKNN